MIRIRFHEMEYLEPKNILWLSVERLPRVAHILCRIRLGIRNASGGFRFKYENFGNCFSCNSIALHVYLYVNLSILCISCRLLVSSTQNLSIHCRSMSLFKLSIPFVYKLIYLYVWLNKFHDLPDFIILDGTFTIIIST